MATTIVTSGIAKAQYAAGINQTINYQGRLLTATGAVVPDGTYNIEFKLYQDGDGTLAGDTAGTTAGSLKWTEDWIYSSGGANDHRVSIKNGYFSVNLGSLTSLASVNFNWDTLWLSANIGNTSTAATFSAASGDGEMLPMKRLASNPYALNSGQLGGLTSSQFVQLGQGIQAATSTTNAAIAINQTGATANILDLQRGGADVQLINNAGQTLFRPTTDSVTALQVQKAGTTTTVFTVDSVNSRIGIGNAAPAWAVDATGSVNASISLKVGGTDVCTGTTCTPASGSANYIQNQNAGAQTSSNFNISGSGTAGSFLTNTIDTPAAGTLSIGTNASSTGLTIGQAGVPVLFPGNINLNSSNTSNNRINIGGTQTSGATSSQYSIQNQLTFAPTANLSNLYSFLNLPVIGTTASNIANVYGQYSRIDTTGGGSPFTGQITTAAALDAGPSSLAGTKPITNYYGLKVDAVNNPGISGNVSTNYGVGITLPTGNSTFTTNYGLNIQGAGGATATNYSLYNSSTAASYFSNSVLFGTTSNANSYQVNVNGTVGATAFQGGSIDSQTAFGSLNIGTVNAGTIGIGVAGQTLNINSASTNFTNGSEYFAGTATGSQVIGIGATLSSSSSYQYGIDNEATFTPQGASTISAIYGNVDIPNLAGTSSLNVSSLQGFVAGIKTTAGYAGTVADARGLSIQSPSIGGTNKFTAYTGIYVNTISGNGSNTSGTITNNGLLVAGSSSGAGTGGSVLNYALNITQPNGTGGNTSNYGLYIQGNGASSGTGVNLAINSTSTASSILAGNLTVGGSNNQSQLIITANSSQAAANPLLVLNSSTGTELARVSANVNSNIFVGYLSGNTITTGTANSFVGAQAGAQNTNGYSNTAFGSTALVSNLGGGLNTAIGVGALSNIVGTNNSTAVGANSLINTTGANNTAVGSAAGLSNVTGTKNSFFGYNAGASDSLGVFSTGTALQNATAIGDFAQVQQSNSIILGSVDTQTSVGIGTTEPMNLFSVSPMQYQTGTVKRTNGSTTLTGTSTVWTSAMTDDIIIFADGTQNVVGTVVSGTSITMDNTYGGTTDATGVGYRFFRPGFQVSNAGNAYVQNTSTNAFMIQNSSSGTLFNADTTNGRISIGTSGTSTAQLYVAGNNAPAYVGQNSDANQSSPQSVATSGRYAYVTSYSNNKLLAYDVSSGTPVYTGQNSDANMSGPIYIAIAGRYAYVSSATKLYIYDISNGVPVYVSQNSDANIAGANAVAVSGRYVFVTNSTAGKLLTYDVSSGTPVYLGQNSDSNAANAAGLAIFGRYAYVTNGGSTGKLVTYDISNGTAVYVGQNSDSNLNFPVGVTVAGEYAYVANRGNGKLDVYNISTGTPVYVSQNSDANLSSGPNNVQVFGRYAYVLVYGASGAFDTYDISSGTPVFVGQNFGGITLNNPTGFAVSGRYAFVLNDGYNKLYGFDLGGAYIQQLESGSTQTGSLSVDTNASIGGNTSVQGGLSVGSSLQVTGNIGTSGTVAIQPATASATAFQVQNTAGVPIFLVDTATNASGNLVTSGGFEAGGTTPTNWTTIGGATQVRNTTAPNHYGGVASDFITGSASGAGISTSAFNSSPSALPYTVSFYVQSNTGSVVSSSNFSVSFNSGTLTACNAGVSLVNTGFQRVICNITAGAIVTSLQIVQTTASATTYYIDAVQMVSGGAATPSTAAGAIQLRGTIDSPVVFQAVSNSPTAFQIQSTGSTTLFTADSLFKNIIIGSNVTDGIQVGLQLDSSNQYADNGTCSATVNQGSLYYNTNTTSIRTCDNSGTWDDVITTSGLGLLAFGVVETSGSNPGDILSAANANVSGPCKVSWNSATSVLVQPCTVYSGGRRLVVPSTVVVNLTTTTTNRWENLCFSTSTGAVSTTGLPTFVGPAAAQLSTAILPAWNPASPVECLATIQQGTATNGSFATGGQIWDTRTFLTTNKEYAPVFTGSPVADGMLATANGGNIIPATTTASQPNIRGVVVATSGLSATNTVPNAIIAISGPAYVQVTSVASVNNIITTGGTTAGYGTSIVNAAANTAPYTTLQRYSLLGTARGITSSTCNSASSCDGSVYTVIAIQ